jgi:protein ImuB
LPVIPSFSADDDRGEHAERVLAGDLIAAVEKTGLPARAGIASSKLAARVAAGLPDSPRVVPPEEAAQFLAPLPLSRLSPEIEIAATLERWGLRSIGDFARLPPAQVESRLGGLGRHFHAAARGLDPRPLEPRLPALSFSEGMDLEWPLVALEPFLFVGNAALERLTRRLDAQGLACRRLELALKLDPDGCDARAIALPAPTRDVKTLLTLVRLELEARPPGAPVTGFTFSAHPDQPRRAQLSLFGPPALSPDRLATTIARLAALLGADRVSSPRTVDGHRPERFASSGYEPPSPLEVARPPRAGRGLLAVRVLRPPVELEVITKGEERGALALPPGEGGGEGVPVAHLRLLSVKSANGASPEIAGAVRIAAGPWSMEEGWWSGAPAARDYWDVELSESGLYRIYRDRASKAWFADGVYD